MSERIRPVHEREGLVASVLMMVIANLVLFWAPFFNGLVAGGIGGFRTGHVGRAVAACLAATLGCVGFFVVAYYFFQVSPKDLWYNRGVLAWAASTLAGMLAGAIPMAIAKRYGGTRELLEVVPVRRHRGGLFRRHHRTV